MTTTEKCVRALQDLGFTGLEAQVYVYLLWNAPATGYRISHAIGKPTANTYKALASLAAQGAVLIDDGGSGVAHAVPSEELLAALERRGREQYATVRAALAEPAPDDPDAPDDHVYALKDSGQVVERARAMLLRARQIVLGDLFPGTLDLLRDDLAACAARGVRVVVRAYTPDRAGESLIVCRPGRGVPGGWPGQQLSLVVDADEHLLALLSADLDQVHQAVWSRSAFLSCLQHNHLSMELMVTVRAQDGVGGTNDDLSGITILASEPEGLRRLRAQVAGRRCPQDTGNDDVVPPDDDLATDAGTDTILKGAP